MPGTIFSEKQPMATRVFRDFFQYIKALFLENQFPTVGHTSFFKKYHFSGPSLQTPYCPLHMKLPTQYYQGNF